MVIDARPANCHFEDADSVRFCAGRAFSEIRADDQGPFFLSGVDIEVAFYHVVLTQVIFCWPPKEMRRPDWIWRLKRALQGTRIASQLFQAAVREMYANHGWMEIKTVACAFYHPGKDSLSCHHGDDFLTEAEPT